MNLGGELRRLGDDIARAVDSYLGLTITVTGMSGPVSLTTWREPGEVAVGTSLLIPLRPICGSAPGSTLILYAAVPGAFVDLAADLSYTAGEPLTAFLLDRHLSEHPAHSKTSQSTGLTGFSNINRAIGVLLACGRTREQAHTELWDRAAGTVPRDLHASAQAIIDRAALGVGPRQF